MLDLYTVNDAYISYLREKVPNVYDPHCGHRKHTRKYVGILLKINEFSYFAPLSSPKKSDYVNGHQIRKSVLTIFRLTKHSNNTIALLGTIRLSNMIPVPDTEVTKYDAEGEKDSQYKELIKDELNWLERNDTDIINSANTIYILKMHEEERRNSKNERLLDSILPFLTLQQLCKAWESTHK